MRKIDELAVATIRSLCIDEVNQANSGHPGMALGSAPILYTLFTKHLVADPKNPNWYNRDRFVLSAGHASALLYAMLHISGYDLSLDELKKFRQIDSLTPGHPEFGHTVGVDASSGPLGQGIAQGVGLAMAEAAVAANYPEGQRIMNHYTYVLCGDGCLQEGISQEAISLAGHQKLNKLILIYDANNVTLDGGLDLSFSEDVKGRFIASEWNVLEVKDGNNMDAIDEALARAKKSNKPVLIIVHTIIGYGSAKQGTSKVHGSPLGIEDGKHAKVDVYGFDHEDFYIPQEVYEEFNNTFGARGQKARLAWEEELKKYGESHKEELARFLKLQDLSVADYLPEEMPEFVEGSQVSTRVASGKALNYYMKALPNLIGGSADVAGSVMTKLDDGVNFDALHREGHNINWGIREFAMASAQNGMLLHGGLRTYVGCFCVFADYLKPALRMGSLSHLPGIFLFSHDGLAIGEDGPTHEPIEQLAMLRSTPGVQVIRPADERETYAAWLVALKSVKKPTCLILSRQNLPLLKGSNKEGVEKGAYIISKEAKKAQYILLATGSEVSMAIEAQQILLEKGIDVRVVSMPSWEIFEEQSEEYKREVLCLPREKRVSIEIQSTFGWERYADHQFGVNQFGYSGKAKDVYAKLGFTVDAIVKLVESIK